MKKSNQQVDGLGEQLRNYELTPSDRVWQGIEEASPVPSPQLPRPRVWLYGAAAILIVAASFVLYQLYNQNSSDMEQIEVLVPRVAANDTTSDTGAITPEPEGGEQTHATDNETMDDLQSDQGCNATQETTATPKANPAPGTGTATTHNKVLVPTVTVPVRTETRPVQVPPTAPEVTTATRPAATTQPSETIAQPVDVPAEEQVVPEDLLQWEMPNAFAPNFDGVNDYLKPVIINHADVTDFKMQIYTRSGNLLFESYNIDNGWDGRHNGVLVPPQVYIWAVSFRDMEGKIYARRGYVTLIR